MPMPPHKAMAMAISDSVTVSMSEEMIGMLRLIDSAREVFRSVPEGVTSEKRVASDKSSKVRPVGLASSKNSSAGR